MLIVSNFHEYYDTACIYGIDKEYVYNRKTEVLKGTFGRWPYEEKYKKTKANVVTYYEVHKRVIGFCGHLFPVVTVEKRIEESKPELFSFYSTQKVYDFFAKEKVALKDEQHRYWSIRDFSISSKKGLDQLFEGSEFKKLEKEFQNYKCPVFIYGRFAEKDKIILKEKLILNPRLTDYRFAQVKDPVTAFQDVYLYLAGVLGISNMQMPEFSDKLKAQAHGMDKNSFRKPPGTKRGKPKWR